MCVATVYGRYHYVADVIAGIAVGSIGWAAGQRLMRKSASRRSLEYFFLAAQVAHRTEVSDEENKAVLIFSAHVPSESRRYSNPSPQHEPLYPASRPSGFDMMLAPDVVAEAERRIQSEAGHIAVSAQHTHLVGARLEIGVRRIIVSRRRQIDGREMRQGQELLTIRLQLHQFADGCQSGRLRIEIHDELRIVVPAGIDAQMSLTIGEKCRPFDEKQTG